MHKHLKLAAVLCLCIVACDKEQPTPPSIESQPAPAATLGSPPAPATKLADPAPAPDEQPAIPAVADKADAERSGVDKALSPQPSAAPLKDSLAAAGEGEGPKVKKKLAMSDGGTHGGGLRSGRGVGSGGGIGVGRIGGLGQVDVGGGKGAGGKIGKKGRVSIVASSGQAYGYGTISARGVGAAPSTRRPAPDAVASGDDFKSYGVNTMVSTAKDKLSTFAVDVDTGAYTIARRQLESGALPASSSVRVEEYVNYFAYNYPAPSKGAFSVSMEAAPSPFEATPGRYLLRVGVQGKRVAAKERKPLHLTFLVDVSGSMSSVDKLPLAQKSLKILTNTLREGDTVALVTYAGRTGVVLPATDAAYKGRILAAIDDLSAGGGTAMESGMELAYKQALSTYKAGHVNRVIVLSDGDANIGKTDHPQILKSVQTYVDKGVTLSTIGFGMGNYKDTMMEQLANKGNGNYYYVDSQKEANKVFGEQASGTLEVIAKDVKLQVEFDPDKVSEYRLLGYENRDIADKDFRNDKVDAGEIGAGHTVTAFYEVVFKAEPSAGFATVRVRHKAPEGDVASEQAFVVTPSDMRAKVGDASKDFQFGASVVAFAEILRKSPYAKGLSLALVEELAMAASSPNQKDRLEFIELVKKARALVKA
jgi:Ca-activated chloride channel homolog